MENELSFFRSVEATLPFAGWNLYDFGGGNTFMPVPSENGTWILKKVFGFASDDFKKFTFLEIASSGETLESLWNRIDIAINRAFPSLEEALHNVLKA